MLASLNSKTGAYFCINLRKCHSITTCTTRSSRISSLSLSWEREQETRPIFLKSERCRSRLRSTHQLNSFGFLSIYQFSSTSRSRSYSTISRSICRLRLRRSNTDYVGSDILNTRIRNVGLAGDCQKLVNCSNSHNASSRFLRKFNSSVQLNTPFDLLSTKGISRECWSCGQKANSIEELFFCSTCGSVQKPAYEVTYFELLESDGLFDIDIGQLGKIFRKRQKRLHPDMFSLKSKVSS